MGNWGKMAWSKPATPDNKLSGLVGQPLAPKTWNLGGGIGTPKPVTPAAGLFGSKLRRR